LAIALLVLAAAVVVLFAMFGELAARLPQLNVGYLEPFVRPLDGALLGAFPIEWPTSLEELSDNSSTSLLVILSTA
jgi:hypothetical protein